MEIKDIIKDEKNITKYYGIERLLDRWYTRRSDSRRDYIKEMIKEHIIKEKGYICKKKGAKHFDFILKDEKYFLVVNMSTDISELPPNTHILKLRGDTQKENAVSTPVGKDMYGRDMYPIICDECGASSTVPFKPDGVRKVFCETCEAKRKLSGKIDMLVDKSTKDNLFFMKRAGNFKSIDELIKWMALHCDLSIFGDIRPIEVMWGPER